MLTAVCRHQCHLAKLYVLNKGCAELQRRYRSFAAVHPLKETRVETQAAMSTGHTISVETDLDTRGTSVGNHRRRQADGYAGRIRRSAST